MMKLSVLALALAACTATDANTDGGGSGGDSCSEIVDCFDTCADNDNACFDACFADGSSDGQQQIDDISNCISSCPDDACVDRECGDLLDRCFGDTGGGGGPQGSMLPASIVGEWSETSFQGNNGSLVTYEFTADGRVHNISTLRYEVLGGCQNVFQTEIDGIVQLSGNVLDFTVLDGTFTEFECGSTTPTNSGPHEDPESYRFATGVDGDGDFLVLEDVSNNIAVTYRRR